MASNNISEQYSIEGKYCTCGHKAYCVWDWAPGHISGFKCVCCVKRIWKETLNNIKDGLKGLPKEKCQ